MFWRISQQFDGVVPSLGSLIIRIVLPSDSQSGSAPAVNTTLICAARHPLASSDSRHGSYQVLVLSISSFQRLTVCLPVRVTGSSSGKLWSPLKSATWHFFSQRFFLVLPSFRSGWDCSCIIVPFQLRVHPGWTFEEQSIYYLALFSYITTAK